MRIGLLLLAALWVACLPGEGRPRNFVVAGQSNAVGGSLQATPLTNGIAWAFDLTGVWVPANDPTIHFPRGSHSSPWPEFVLSDHDVHGQRVNLIATALGATCLMLGNADWKPVAGAVFPEPGWAYQAMLDAIRASGVATVDAVLWHQGECDAQAAQDAQISPAKTRKRYTQALVELGEAILRDTGALTVAAPISLTRCRWDDPTVTPPMDLTCDVLGSIAHKRIPIHDATIEAVSSRPDLFALGPLSDDLLHEPDNAHIHDVNELGRRWASAVHAAGL